MFYLICEACRIVGSEHPENRPIALVYLPQTTHRACLALGLGTILILTSCPACLVIFSRLKYFNIQPAENTKAREFLISVYSIGDITLGTLVLLLLSNPCGNAREEKTLTRSKPITYKNRGVTSSLTRNAFL